jgi:hypothetical protein
MLRLGYFGRTRRKNYYIMNLTEEEAKELTDLISWAVNGCEHGVITYDAWKLKCQKLKEFLKAHGQKPHGFWTV